MASSHWLGAEQHEEGSPLHERAEAFLRQVNWEALLRICSRAHSRVGCRLHEKFSLGQFNLVRHIIYDDGEELIARLRLPDIPTVSGPGKPGEVKSTMEVEIAASKYLRENTNIPVPEIYLYDPDLSRVGAPFMLMEYINGNTAMELSARKGCAPFVFGTEEQDARLRRQMAEIQVDLARCHFDSIGSLRFDEEKQEFCIGPLLMAGLGPWKSSFAYYSDVAEFVLKSSASYDEITSRHSFAVPIVFKNLMPRFCSNDKGSFSLTNLNLGFHNVLVNEDFSLIGVIDLDGIMAAPKEVVGQFPTLSGLDPPAPGIPPKNSLVLERERKEKPLIESYAALLRESAHGPERQIFAGVMTTAHALVRGLEAFGMKGIVNDRWMDSFLYILRTQGLKK